MDFKELAGRIHGMHRTGGAGTSCFLISKPAKRDPMQKQLGFVTHSDQFSTRIAWNGPGEKERSLEDLDTSELAQIRIEEDGYQTFHKPKYTVERARILSERMEKLAIKASGIVNEFDIHGEPDEHVRRDADGAPPLPEDTPEDIQKDAADALAMAEQGPELFKRLDADADKGDQEVLAALDDARGAGVRRTG